MGQALCCPGTASGPLLGVTCCAEPLKASPLAHFHFQKHCIETGDSGGQVSVQGQGLLPSFPTLPLAEPHADHACLCQRLPPSAEGTTEHIGLGLCRQQDPTRPPVPLSLWATSETCLLLGLGFLPSFLRCLKVGRGSWTSRAQHTARGVHTRERSLRGEGRTKAGGQMAHTRELAAGPAPH